MNRISGVIYHGQIIITKYRRKVLTAEMINNLKNILRFPVKNRSVSYWNLDPKAIIVTYWYPSIPIIIFLFLVKNIKSSSSRLLRKEFKIELSKFYYKPVLWSSSYCVISAGGAPLEVIKKYIRNQKTPQ
ncbi:IS200/IS605 family transposase [Crocosphaera watsonii]|uniref:IS200/IS605 family transposase n=1 Tax=Crocosphaera watsonii TaxID=263511 RepID=UPI00267DC835